MTSDGSLVVDMDSHVMEPPDLWQNYLEPRYRDRAIRIERHGCVTDDNVEVEADEDHDAY